MRSATRSSSSTRRARWRRSTFPAGKRIRLGGLVAEGSVKRGAGTSVEFAITDTVKTIAVTYTGLLPDLFREGQGVVAEGKLDPAGRFLADTVLAKHDENYMPPEVAKALKEQGVWQALRQGRQGQRDQMTDRFGPMLRAGELRLPLEGRGRRAMS